MPFVCPTCSRVCPSAQNRDECMRTHSSKRSVKCSECDKKYKHLSSFYAHYKNKHRTPRAEKERDEQHLTSLGQSYSNGWNNAYATLQKLEEERKKRETHDVGTQTSDE